MSELSSPARDAASAAAIELIEPDTAIGLGSGRAVWRLVERIAERWPDGAPLQVVVASEDTGERVRSELGLELAELEGELRLDLALDGADEVGPGLSLIKGGGGALLREKIVVAAARRFVVVAEAAKRVERLGDGFRLPVEVVRFGWRDTRRRLLSHVDDAQLRRADEAAPYLTDEGHFILDCALPRDAEPERLGAELASLPGVVEHGLFLRMADTALLGRPDGGVEVVEAG